MEKLLLRAKENKGDCKFDSFVAQLLHIRLPDRSECWLDPRYNGSAKSEFDEFLANNIEKEMKKLILTCSANNSVTSVWLLSVQTEVKIAWTVTGDFRKFQIGWGT